jgi:hypothetical protein
LAVICGVRIINLENILMTEAVIGFQIAIIISIFVASSYSEEARNTAIGLWVLETFIFVWFMSPLMFIQLVRRTPINGHTFLS